MFGILMARITGTGNATVRRSSQHAYNISAIGAAIGAFILAARPSMLPAKIQNFQYPSAVVLGAMALTFSLIALSLLVKHSSLAKASIAAIGFCVFLVILSIAGSGETISRSEIRSYSARDLSQSLLASGATADNLRLFNLSRSMHYQLNFYLHADLQDWDGQAKSGEVLLGESITCRRLGLGASCKDLWGMKDKTDDWELLEIATPTSLGGLGGGNAGDGLSGRQPR
jgi:hypothetical protein